jgi:acetylornithine deacetylase
MTATLDAAAVLALHRDLVEIPSVSGEEARIAAFVEAYLRDRGAAVRRLGNNLVATAGRGPRLLLNSHLDTVPPAAGWSREPWRAASEDGRVYGLGSNDAKASVAAMMTALCEVAAGGGPCEVTLLLAAEEETGGEGTERVWPLLRREGLRPEGVVVGEPTGLDIARAQKGLLILELLAEGDACHSAHARALGARNAIRTLAGDIAALEAVDLGPEHPLLGATTLEPTLLRAGERRNMVPGEASLYLDLRTVPGVAPEELTARVRRAVKSRVRVHSDRLRPTECPSDAAILAAARAARPEARVTGSRTMSDMVFFEGAPAIKCGPGESDRSHRPDEYVLEREVALGARFYVRLIQAFARKEVA